MSKPRQLRTGHWPCPLVLEQWVIISHAFGSTGLIVSMKPPMQIGHLSVGARSSAATSIDLSNTRIRGLVSLTSRLSTPRLTSPEHVEKVEPSLLDRERRRGNP